MHLPASWLQQLFFDGARAIRLRANTVAAPERSCARGRQQWVSYGPATTATVLRRLALWRLRTTGVRSIRGTLQPHRLML